MNKHMICIECPVGCNLIVEHEGSTMRSVSGNACPKGADYAKAEIENPQRILTATVACKGLKLKMLPVRTDKPIPKARMMEAMAEIRQIRVTQPVTVNAVIRQNLLGLGVDLVATRDCPLAGSG